MAWYHRAWGAVNRSTLYNVILAALSFLPVLDISTDYAFLGLTFSSEPNETERTIGIATIFCLYLSSRLVLVLYALREDYDVTLQNILYFYIPFTFIYHMESKQILNNLGRVIFYFVIPLLLPLIHFLFVCYIVFMQTRAHILDHRDFGAFGPVSFLEISESLPQAGFQSVLFWQTHDLSAPWDTTQFVYVFSMIASTIAITKSIYVYVSRLEVVKDGFNRERIDNGEHLRTLAEKGDLKKFTKVQKKMQNQGIDLMTYKSVGGWTVFLGWCQFGVVSQVETMISQGANVDSSDDFGKSALMFASENGHDSTVAKLISLGADIEAKEQFGKTALVFASENGHDEIVEKLLSLGADIETKDNFGKSALMYASENGHDEIVEKLISLGADTEAKGRNGKTALMYASRGGRDSSVAKLISLGADIGAKDNAGVTALMSASDSGHDSTVAKLISLGADTEVKNNAGVTALMFASESGHDSTVAKLISLGADTEVKNNDGVTVLMFASESGYDSTVAKLISLGADIQAKDKNGKTALMFASESGHDSTVAKLISLGADIQARDHFGKSALLFASENGHDEIVEKLISCYRYIA